MTAAGVHGIADRYVDEFARLDPCAATDAGIPGHDHEITDWSPAGAAARLECNRRTLAALDAVEPANDDERRSVAAMAERLRVEVAFAEADEHLRPLRIIGSPVQDVRQCFDLMPTETDDDWTVIGERMARVPEAIDRIEESLRAGIAIGLVAARRQALACAAQAEAWSGESPYFRILASRRPGDDGLAAAAEAATAAYARLGAYLRGEYAPVADPRDPVGRERYGRFAAAFNGIDLDLDETYAWGFEELHRIESRMVAVAERIAPGASVDEAIAMLETDPDRAVVGAEAFRAWNQELIDTTIAALDGVHFDIAPPLRRCEAMIAPPGGAATMYYTAPSEDFSRPGRTWYPTLGTERFPTWREVSTCFHEAVPGHHLQIGQLRLLGDRLTRWQRLFGFVSGHGEGWALYAERLMGELGFLEDPAHEMGMLAAQAMRAVRVVVDIGMHLELPIPADEDFHPGETWTPELALPFVIGRSRFPEQFMRSEVDRYLGWPGQAISYKVGERIWLEGRETARRAAGPRFDLRSFHSAALDLGGMGLGLLREELGRLPTGP
ncbi:MAG: DUF885 domain-containing protein [Actinomycetota bacterium]